MSARGRLIDWLALKYNVLFCISAGNHKDRIVLDVPRNALAAMTSQAREGAIRYGLVISVEVAEELRLPVYDEIAARIRPAVPVPARTR